MEGSNSISKQLLVSRFPFLGRLRLKNIHTKVYKYQRDLADFIKKRRTVKLLHLLRNYSALVVVISSAILVAATNVAASKGSGGFLFGSGSGDEEQLIAVSKKIDAQSSRKSNLALVPLAKSGIAVDPDAKDDFESEAINPIQGQVMMVSVNTSLRDPEEEGGVEIYTVRTGDTVSAIAARNSITVNTILWANDIDNVDSIMPGDKIFILPVAGVGHTVKSGDTLDSIAKKYKADKEKIITFNGLPADGTIREGDEIIIPGGQKEVPQSPGTASGLLRQYATPLGGTPLISGWRKLDGRAGAGHRFPYGYCTWYVSQRRFIPWGGNAGAWLYNAKAGGYQTSKAPRVGAIIVTAESWWGHVGIVEKVSGGSVTISEMNYNRWGKVNKRTLATSSRVIKGYIY